MGENYHTHSLFQHIEHSTQVYNTVYNEEEIGELN